MGELTLSCLTPHGKEMKVAAKPAKKSWLVSASSWLANSMHGAHPLPTRQSICLEISSSERGGREERHSYLFSGLRTCMPAMATGLRVALEAPMRDWVGLATRAFLEDMIMEFLVSVFEFWYWCVSRSTGACFNSPCTLR